MASFDIIDAAGYGYRLAWHERRYLMRLATVPLLIKFCCLLLIMMVGWNDHFLRQALILLPSYFADGWMLAHYVRLIFLDQRWPFRPTGDPASDRQEMQDRAAGLMAGSLVFVVSRFLVAGIMNVVYQFNSFVAANPAQVSAGLAVVFLMALAFCLWAFRFLWFYIPASVGYGLKQCMLELRGTMTSLCMMGTAAVCFMPVFALVGLITSVLVAPFGTASPASLPLTFDIFFVMLRTAMDTAVALISTGAMAHALSEMIGNRRGPANDQRSR